MKPLITLLTLVLIGCQPLSGQKKFSVELNPQFLWVQSNVDFIPNYLLLNPVLQFNYRPLTAVEGYLRGGGFLVSGDDVVSQRFQEYGGGVRLYFNHFINFKNEWTQKRVSLYAFSDYSFSDYGFDEEGEPTRLPFGAGRIFRGGLGFTIRMGTRLSAGLDYGYINRTSEYDFSNFLRTLRLGYHFNRQERVYPPKQERDPAIVPADEQEEAPGEGVKRYAVSISYNYLGYAEPITDLTVHTERNHLLDLTFWIANRYGITASTNFIRSNTDTSGTDLRDARTYALSLRRNLLPSLKHRFYVELGGGFGNYCSCGDDLPRVRDNLRYWKFAFGAELTLFRGFALSAQFQNNNILDKISDKYGYNVLAGGVTITL